MNKKVLVVDCRMIFMSGIGTYIQNILPAIIESGMFDVTCLVSEIPQSVCFKNNVRYIIIKSKIFTLLEHLELFWKIPKCDIYWSPNINIPFLYIKANYIYATIHDLNIIATKSKFSLSYWVFRIYIFLVGIKAERIFTVSNFSKNEILKYTEIKKEKIIVCHLAVSNNFNSGFQYSKISERYLLLVGNVKRHKNIEIVLKAMEYVSDKSLKLFIVGKIEGFKDRYKEVSFYINNIDSRIVFLGKVDEARLKNYYANALIFIFPSKYEGFGLPLLEAMKFKLPIVSSNSASLPEVGGDAVLYFDPENEFELANIINGIVEGKIIPPIGNYNKLLNKYSWNKAINIHLNVFSRKTGSAI